MTLSRSGRYVLPLIGVSLTVYILAVAKDLIIPVVLALLIFFIVVMIAGGFQKIPRIGKHIPKWVAIVLSFATVVLFFYLLSGFVSQSIEDVPKVYPEYQQKLSGIVVESAEFFGVETPRSVSEMIQQIDLVKFSTGLGQTLLSMASRVGLIFFFLIFLFFEYAVFEQKMEKAFPKKIHRKKVKDLIKKIAADVAKYFRLKSVISFFVGYGSYIVLKLFHVDLAEFWAILLFLLNFIPNVGSIIAVMFPTIVSLIQFQNDAIWWIISWQFIVIVSLLVAIQVFMGNVIEPRWLGNSLNLSPLVILVSLTVWASIWGIVGMFLCVPIMVIINTVLANFDKTRKMAIFLSQNGNV